MNQKERGGNRDVVSDSNDEHNTDSQRNNDCLEMANVSRTLYATYKKETKINLW